MKTPASFLRPRSLFAGCLALVATVMHADQNLAGNVTVTGGSSTGNLIVTGAISAAGTVDTDSSLLIGVQSSSFGAELLYQDSDTDTFKFSLNRDPASWLWQHNSAVPAMRLSSVHNLVLYRTDGPTAGVTLSGMGASLKLGSTATLSGDGSGVFTTSGALSVGGTLAASGALTAPSATFASGLNDTPIGSTTPSTGVFTTVTATGQGSRLGTASGNWTSPTTSNTNLLLYNNSSTNWSGIGADAGGGMYFVTGTATPTAKLKLDTSGNAMLAGNLGIGTASPAYKLDVVDTSGSAYARVFSNNPSNGRTATLEIAAANGSDSGTASILRFSALTSQQYSKLNVQNSAGSNLMTVLDNGNVGIGTTAPNSQLEISSSGSGNSPHLRLTNTSGATPGYFGPAVVLNNSVSGKHGYVLQQRQDANSYFSIANMSSPYTEYLVVDQSGRVGIGTTSPVGKVEIIKDSTYNDLDTSALNLTTASSPSSQLRMGFDLAIDAAYLQSVRTGVAVKPLVLNAMGGSVGIGTTSPGAYTLAVKGSIHAQEVVVDDTGWADYVFDEGYRLAPLAEVEQHIKAEKHLPGIPSAAEVAEHGVSMGAMQAKLLSKVEELTLHLIRMEKENAALRERVQVLETAASVR